MNWFKKQSIIVKFIVVAVGLFFLSAVVAGIYEGIVGEEETIVEVEKETKKKEESKKKEETEQNKLEEEKQNKEKEKKIEQKEKNKKKKEKAVKEKENKKEIEAKKKQNKEQTFDDFSTAEYSIEDIEAEMKDDTLHFHFRWINQSGQSTPFTALGYVDVSQGDEILKEVSDAYDPSNISGILFKNANGGGHAVDLEYELKNDKDIKVLFGTTIEGSDRKEELIIESD